MTTKTGFHKNIVAGALGLALCATPSVSHAFDDDTHFQATCFVTQMVGMSPRDALLVASADQMVDENDSTVSEVFKRSVNRNFHAFGNYMYNNTHRINMYNFVINYWKATHNWDVTLIYFGQFLHWEQDSYAHRTNDAGQYSATPVMYGVDWGHGLHGHQPDYTPYRPTMTRMAYLDSARWTWQFLADTAGDSLHWLYPPIANQYVTRNAWNMDFTKINTMVGLMALWEEKRYTWDWKGDYDMVNNVAAFYGFCQGRTLGANATGLMWMKNLQVPIDANKVKIRYYAATNTDFYNLNWAKINTVDWTHLYNAEHYNGFSKYPVTPYHWF